MHGKNNIITVIIPTHNRAKELELTLPSYIRNRLIKKIIVVNNGSTDDTSTVIASFREKTDSVREIKIHKKSGAQKARMVGISEAHTEYVLLGEDDVYLAPDYTDVLHKQLNEFSCDTISGNLVPVRMDSDCQIEEFVKNTKQTLGWPQDLRPFRIPEENFRSGKPAVVPFTHAIALVKRKLFNEVSFDPWYSGTGFREETDFFLSARKNGAKIFFTPDTSCYHIRGVMSKKGGQRANRVLVEFWAMYNTWYMLKKHWDILSADLRLRHGPLFNTFLYMLHREYNYLLRLVNHKY